MTIINVCMDSVTTATQSGGATNVRKSAFPGPLGGIRGGLGGRIRGELQNKTVGALVMTNDKIEVRSDWLTAHRSYQLNIA